jgi:hypothetical protein
MSVTFKSYTSWPSHFLYKKWTAAVRQNQNCYCTAANGALTTIGNAKELPALLRYNNTNGVCTLDWLCLAERSLSGRRGRGFFTAYASRAHVVPRWRALRALSQNGYGTIATFRCLLCSFFSPCAAAAWHYAGSGGGGFVG